MRQVANSLENFEENQTNLNPFEVIYNYRNNMLKKRRKVLRKKIIQLRMNALISETESRQSQEIIEESKWDAFEQSAPFKVDLSDTNPSFYYLDVSMHEEQDIYSVNSCQTLLQTKNIFQQAFVPCQFIHPHQI